MKTKLSLIFLFVGAFYCQLIYAQTVYTIGGSNPDFATINAANSFLQSTTLTETLIFSIRDGVYEENLMLDEINGASATNRVIFRGESGDRTQVIIGRTNPENNQTAIKIEGTDFLSFEHLTIQTAPSASYHFAVSVEGNAESIVFDDVVIQSIGGTQYTVRDLVQIYPLNSEYTEVTIRNSLLNGGSTAVAIYNGNTGNDLLTIENTQIIAHEIGIRSTATVILEIINNHIAPPIEEPTGTFIPIVLEGNTRLADIRQNNLFSTDGSAISIYSQYGRVEKVNIENNYIQLLNKDYFGRQNLIVVSHTDVLNIIHNTLRSNMNGTNDRYLNLSAKEVKVLNNLAIEEGFGSFILLDSNELINATIDYNNFYGSSAIWTSNNNHSLSQWQATTGYDTHSTTHQVYFTNATTFEQFDTRLNNAGQAIMEVNTDIRGNARHSSTPDIGAFEYDPFLVDAGILNLTLPDRPFNAGSYPITVDLRNFGSEPLTMATITYSINNNTPQTVQWIGSLASNTSTTVTLPDVNFQANQPNEIIVEVEMPNGTTDIAPYNNSIEQMDIYAALTGNYLVGEDVNADFPTLSKAIEVLHFAGIGGMTQFNLVSGIHYGTYQFAYVPTTNNAALLTIQADSGTPSDVVLQLPPTQNRGTIFYIESFNKLTLQHLSFKGIDIQDMTAIVVGDSQNLTCHDLQVDYDNPFSTAIEIGFGIAENLLFSDCKINNALIGINKRNGEAKNLTIQNCVIDAYGNGINLRNTENVQLLNNRINLGDIDPNLFLTGFNYNGVILNGSKGDVVVQQNQIRGFRNSVFIFSGFSSNNDKLLMSNNWLHYDNRESPYPDRNAVIINDLAELLFINNNITGNYLDYSKGMLQLNAIVAGAILNNIIIGKSKTPIYEIFGSGNSVNVQYDHNVLYNEEAPIVLNSIIGVNTFAEWQNQNNNAQNSAFFFPIFTAPNTYETYDLRLNAAATPNPSVMTDILGQQRDANTPDIGVFEFDPPANDAGITMINLPSVPFEPGDYELAFELKNFGTNPLTQVDIIYTVNGIVQNTTWNGNLASLATTEVILPTVNLADNLEYTITVATANPNGNVDEQVYNDQSIETQVYTALGGNYSVGTANSDFPDLATLSAVTQRGGVYAPVFFNIAAGNYTESVVLDSIPGAAVDKTVTLQSAADDARTVQLSEGSENFIIQCQRSSHLVFKKLSFVVTGDRNRAIDAPIRFNKNQITDCHFSTTATEVRFIELGRDENRVVNNNIISNNHFINGQVGLLLFGSFKVFTGGGNRIEQNNFANQQAWAVNMVDAFQTTINKNHFTNCSIAIYGTGGAGTVINANQIFSGEQTSLGINLESDTNEGIYSTLITNNFIKSDEVNLLFAGIRLVQMSEVNIYHNTVRIDAVDGVEKNDLRYTLLLSNSFNINVQNNLLVSERYGVIGINTYNPNTIIDNNFYYTTGFFAALLNSVSGGRSFAEWQRQTGFDANSFIGNPDWQNAPLYGANNQLIRTVTDPTIAAQFPSDIETNSRPTMQAAAGAYESAQFTTDAAILQIPEVVNGVAPGEQTISLQLINLGTTELTDLTVEWTVNGVQQTAVDWTGTLLPFADLALELGTTNFTLGTDYSISATIITNNASDGHLPNNYINYSSIPVRLAGTYTVGGEQADFTDLLTALTTINAVGVAADVEFLLRDGHYSTHTGIGDFHNITGSKVTIRSESGDPTEVVLSYDATDFTEGGFYVQDMKHLALADITLRSELNRLSALTIFGKVGIVELKNCHLLRNEVHFSNNGLLEMSSSATVDQLQIENSTFSNGEYGLKLSGVKQLHLTNNQFINQRSYGVQVYDFSENMIIRKNIFTHIQEEYDYTGLDLAFGIGGIIEKNQFFIEAQGGKALVVERIYGNTPMLIANNFLLIDSENMYGMYIDASLNQGVEVLHNTIRGDMAYCYYSEFYSSNLEIVSGNLFYNHGIGYAFYKRYNNSGSLFSTDYNNYFTNGEQLAYYNNQDFATLSNWQAQHSDLNQHSFSTTVQFADTDSYIYQAPSLDRAVPFSTTIEDIEDNPRSTNGTSIGCYETSFAPLAIEIFDFFVFQNEEETVELNWHITGRELIDITVERSLDGSHFTAISQIGDRLFFDDTFTDNYPHQGDNFYRLRVTDSSGTITYSLIKWININPYSEIQIYPNPVRDLLTLKSVEPMTNFRVVNLIGQVVKTMKTTTNSKGIDIDLIDLPVGVYSLEVQIKSVWNKYKIIKIGNK